MDSVISYPNRGPWGDSRYRGNCSGYLYRDLFSALRPRDVIDPTSGGGTSIQVALEMGIPAVGLDLRDGFNGLRDSIVLAAGGPADVCISHFPYHGIITYSGERWPGAHPDDLSRCDSVEDFLCKAHQFLLNQRDATRPGRHYATLIGDIRQDGRYISLQAEFISRMPASELASVVIKRQHACTSDRGRNNQSILGLPRIGHEFLLIWRRPGRCSTLLGSLREMATLAHARLQGTWRSTVRQALVSLGGEADLADLYERISEVAADRSAANPNWQAKVRQVVQVAPDFERVRRGRWRLA